MLQRVTTTDDALDVYGDHDVSSKIIAHARKGSEIQLGIGAIDDGREWMEAILEDGTAGYVLGPSARGHTTLGALPSQETTTAQLAVCPQCKSVHSPDALVCECGYNFPARKEQTGGGKSRACVISVTLPDRLVKEYADGEIKESLRRDIISGLLSMDCAAEKRALANGKTTKTSGTLRTIAKSMFCLDSLYRPVWAHAMRGLAWGAGIGAGLKLLDTIVELWAVNPLLGFLTAAAVASIFIPKSSLYVIGAIVFISIKAGVSMNVYFAVIGAAAAGALLGMLPGMAIGALVGAVRSFSQPRAHDAVRERSLAMAATLLLPASCGAAIIHLYLFWLNPMVAAWVAKK
ncbi:MAG: hypothetical protein ACRD4O_11530 [Bryobacteraceae bacterium]